MHIVHIFIRSIDKIKFHTSDVDVDVETLPGTNPPSSSSSKCN